MPTKKRYDRGFRGSSPNSVRHPGPSRQPTLTERLPGHRSRVHDGLDARADWGSDHPGDETDMDGVSNPDRNGGMRFYRGIDVSDRSDREALGVDRLKYTWRSITGPTPQVDHGDREAARAYLEKINIAIDQGGWTTSEASGLYLAKKVWTARANGKDPRYSEVGNRQGGLTKEETSAVKLRQVINDMQDILEGHGKSHGD